MSIKRLWVLNSKCSRESLSMCGERRTQNRFIDVGKGTGPDTRALGGFDYLTGGLVKYPVVIRF